MAIEIFVVDWTIPKPFKDALTQSASHESGVYAMYKVTGRNAILHYIGKSKDFYKRFGTHRNAASHLMNDAEMDKCLVSFGLVSCFEKSRMSQDITPEQLHDLESFLINSKKPTGNDDSTKKGYKGCATIVFNDGNRGGFPEIMTNNQDVIKLLKEKL